MRPSDLDPLFAPSSSLKGVGPKLSITLTKLTARGRVEQDARVIDLIFHLPNAFIDRGNLQSVALAKSGEIVTLKLHIDEHRPPPRHNRKVPYKIAAHDESGELQLTFFNAHGDYLLRTLPIGEERYVSGRVEAFNAITQMTHPDLVASEEEFRTMPKLEAVYPMTQGLSKKVLTRTINDALTRLPHFPEWIDPAVAEKRKWPSFHEALHRVHRPDGLSDPLATDPGYERLAYDELLAGQLALRLVRNHIQKRHGVARLGTGELTKAIRETLPFSLTNAQEQAISEIGADLVKRERMTRLLQGDVGAGKTVVGLMAIAQATEAGFQSALMTPTEVLARQHFSTIEPIANRVALRIALLTGREKGKERRDILTALEEGKLDLVIGTHALFQEGVVFKALGLAIIDEQHRFGVSQRLALTSKGEATDLLAMTATPIPRTLVMTYFGDMDVSKLEGKPPGRQPIKTVSLSVDRLDDLTERMRAAMATGEKVYWVCPLVDENDELSATAATARFQALRGEFGDVVSLVHGQMPAVEKDAAMHRFKCGEVRVLVATTVIEVGVDVPDATIIVIENAERFGLAQLHQLRGRVGRGAKPSSCVLLYQAPLGDVARARLNTMKETDDGFVIAEQDLKLRGEGDILGTRQSGLPGFQIADMEHHQHLLETARDDAKLFLTRDPTLKSMRGDAIRKLLYLFGKDDAIRLLRAG